MMRVLAGDIGGTNARFMLAELTGAGHRVLARKTLASGDYPSLVEALRAFLASQGDVHVESTCLAVAGPVEDAGGGQRARITNLPWEVDAGVVAKALGGTRVQLLNDFAAAALGIEALEPDELIALQEGSERSDAPRAVIGAGTGLGQAILVSCAGRYEPLATEGGHAAFAPADALQDALLVHLRERFGRVSCERILSGSGLVNIYEFLRERGAAIESQDTAQAMRAGDPAAAVSAAALRGRDTLAGEALDLFVRIYGAHAGDVALSVLAHGGVYIAGGIALRIVAKLQDGAFVRAFNDKGRMSLLTRAMPVRVVRNEAVGLLGAMVAAGRAAPGHS